MNNGYVALWRDIQVHPVFADAKLLKLFLWLILNVSRKRIVVQKKIGRSLRIFTVLPGEMVNGREHIAKALGVDPSTIRNRLERLEKMGCITLSRDRRNPLIRITNWTQYQAGNETSEDIKKDINQGHQKPRLKPRKNRAQTDIDESREDIIKTDVRGQPEDIKKDINRGHQKASEKPRKNRAQTDIDESSEDIIKTAVRGQETISNKNNTPYSPPKGEWVGGDGQPEIPPMLDNSRFRETWSTYLDWVFVRTGKQLDGITAKLRLDLLCRREAQRKGKAVADLRLTMERAEKTGTIFDSDRELCSVDSESTGRRKV